MAEGHHFQDLYPSSTCGRMVVYKTWRGLCVSLSGAGLKHCHVKVIGFVNLPKWYLEEKSTFHSACEWMSITAYPPLQDDFIHALQRRGLNMCAVRLCAPSFLFKVPFQDSYSGHRNLRGALLTEILKKSLKKKKRKRKKSNVFCSEQWVIKTEYVVVLNQPWGDIEKNNLDALNSSGNAQHSLTPQRRAGQRSGKPCPAT